MNTKKIITAPTYLHETLLHELLHHYHTDALGHVAVVPRAALISASEHNSSVLLEQTFQRIQTVIDQCPHFISMIKNPSFLKQCSDFRKDMAEYQISLNNLPEQDDFQKELKLLISSFYDLPTSSASLIESLKDTAPLDHVHLYPSFQHSLFDKKVTDHFIKRGAKAIQKPQISSYKSGRSALNRRQEVEACAQYIIEHQLDPKDVTIVLCDPANDQKVLELVFDRYQLPYGFVSKTESSKIVQLYLSAVYFLKDKTLDALVHYLHLASSNLPHFDALMDYIDLFVEDIEQFNHPFTHIKECMCEALLLDDYQKQDLLELEAKAELARQNLLLPEGHDPLVDAYALCRFHPLLNQEDELAVFYRIKGILESHYQVIHQQEYFDLICFEIEQLNKSTSDSFMNRICVSDMTHPVPVRQQAFVLGCIQSSFPNFQGCSGVFDEDYVSFVKGYPSKTERQAFHGQQISWIFHCAESIIFSTSCADYEGKGRQMSVEIESRLDEKTKPWNIMKHQEKHHVEFKLQPDTARQLFLRENKLHGSISSFEKWFHCPASYFLNSGLKLRKQEHPEFNIALMGTLQHAILEEIIDRYHKEIHSCTEEVLREITESVFDPVVQLFVKKRTFLTVTKNRCIKNMTLILQFLSEMEKNTDFKPKEMEYPFKTILNKYDPVPVQIRGIIDRIDMTHDMLRILDYKSSHKTLSISKAQNGLQLQLLTYLYIAAKTLKKTAAGCYYVSMKNDDINAPVNKLDSRKMEIVDADESDAMELWTQSHRLDGISFADTDMLDFDGSHIKGFKNGRPAKTYTFEDLSGFIQTIYQYLADKVSSGHISLTPTEDACLFCDHFSICRFHSLKGKTNVPEGLTSHFFKEVK